MEGAKVSKFALLDLRRTSLPTSRTKAQGSCLVAVGVLVVLAVISRKSVDRGLVPHYLLFVISLADRVVKIAGSRRGPTPQ